VVVGAAAFVMMHRRPRKYDRFIQMIIITYMTFVLGGVLMLFACAIQLYYLGLDTMYQQSGAYTGAGIGLTAMLWTLVPSMVLIWYGEYYRRATEGLCLKCAYDVRGVTGVTCPECGAEIERRVYEIAEEGVRVGERRHGLGRESRKSEKLESRK